MSPPPLPSVAVADAAAAARRGAEEIAGALNDAVGARGLAHVAVSGGSTPWLMLEVLRGLDVPWEAVHAWQVDERVAPDGDPVRNLSRLEGLLDPRAVLHPIPVGDRRPEDAARAYAAELPDRLDLVHLGLGADGHTASLVPGDPVLDVLDLAVAATAAPYQGHRRVTLTYPTLAAARRRLWLVVGADKSSALDRLLAGDRSVPAGRVSREAVLVVADAAALSTAGAGPTAG